MYTGQQYVDGARKSLDDPNKTTWTDDVLLEFINDTREDLWMKARWNFKKAVDKTLDSEVDIAEYTKPVGIRTIIGIAITLSDNKYHLRHLTLDDYLARTRSLSQSGTPTGWFSQGLTFFVDPAPEEAGTDNIDVFGYGAVTRLALTDTESNFNEDFYLAIKLGGIAMAWDKDEDGINSDPYWRRYLDQIKFLKRDYVPEQTGLPVGRFAEDYIDELHPQRIPTLS